MEQINDDDDDEPKLTSNAVQIILANEHSTFTR